MMISPDILARLVQQVAPGLPYNTGGSVSPVGGGMPGKGGGLVTGQPVPAGPIKQQFPAMTSPMAGAAPGTMPNIREAMMANIGGMLGQPNFGIPQFAPRAGEAGVPGLGRPVLPSAPPAAVLPVSPTPIGNNPGDRYGFQGRSLYAAR